MHSHFIIIYLAFLLTACASSPYVPAIDETTVGYSERLIAPSTYHITYTSRRFASQNSANQQVLRRAADLCKGPFAELPMDPKTVIIRSCDSHPWSPCRDKFAQAWVRCGT